MPRRKRELTDEDRAFYASFKPIDVGIRHVRIDEDEFYRRLGIDIGKFKIIAVNDPSADGALLTLKLRDFK